MRAVSLRRQRENRTRRRVVAALFEAAPWCARCGNVYPQYRLDAHELLSRARGGSITDPANIRLLCRRCHDWVTTHPTDALVEGWARPSGGAV